MGSAELKADRKELRNPRKMETAVQQEASFKELQMNRQKQMCNIKQFSVFLK